MGVADLPSLLQPGDLMVVNDTRVIPARLHARRGEARVEIMLNRAEAGGIWHALVRGAKKLRPGDVLTIEGAPELRPRVVERQDGGAVLLDFGPDQALLASALEQAGEIPCPPISPARTARRSRTARTTPTSSPRQPGAVAAPTASLHFTPALLEALAARGVAQVEVTLHVGAGTFLPIRTDNPRAHKLHAEWGEITPEAAAAINAARARGGRIVAIGTTALRLLESAVDENGIVHPFQGLTDIFLLPGHRFHSADVLLTNFHLPKSSLFMLVSAFAGTRRMRRCLCPCRRRRLSLLFLWRCQPAVPGEREVTLSWSCQCHDGKARAGTLHTAHGEVQTPVFMPVGTAGTVKAMTADAVRATGASIVLGNTYHLMLRPGAERVGRLGGLHKMMDWHGPILTDSGGFQVMSLSKLRKMDKDGVTFQSHINGEKFRLTPERSIEIQHLLDADITMCFDECIEYPATHEEAARAMRLSMALGAALPDAFVRAKGYGLFGIQQGSTFEDLRAESARR
jgi:S-adenosylmethionine:tRNA ribosyltransferase-isomerase